MVAREPRRPVGSPDAPASGGLVLEGVIAGYGGEPVLRGVNVTASLSEVVGLIGPNGSGKTTLIRVASRGLAPAAGRVRVAGQDPYLLPARRAARLVAVVPQEVAPAFEYTVAEVVGMGRTAHLSRWGGGGEEDRRAIRRAMEAADVAGLAGRSFRELSGGERQRVVLAQALAQEAPVLLLDEPTTHLDVRHVLDLLALVRMLARARGVAVLGVFHDLNLAASACDRLVAISEGRVVADGPPGRVITAALLSDVYGVEAEVTLSAAGTPAVVVAPGLHGAPAPAGGPRVHVVGGGGRGAALMRMLVERGARVSAGVLHATDSDAIEAARLNVPRVTVPPFSDIDADRERECWRLVEGVAAVVVCDAPFGTANLANLRIAAAAAEAGARVVLLDTGPIEERDFTGGRAAGMWHRIAAKAVVVGSAWQAVEAALTDGPRRGSSG